MKSSRVQMLENALTKAASSEETSRVAAMIRSREDTRAEADLLFGEKATEMRKRDRGLLEKLFVQTPVSQTMAPNLQKEASGLEDKTPPLGAAVSEFFEKKAYLTNAQRRFPELLKAGAAPPTVPNLKARKTDSPTGALARVSGLSGGSA